MFKPTSFSLRTSNTLYLRRNVATRGRPTATMEFPEERGAFIQRSKPIFNADPNMHYTITIQEARDAYECCNNVKGASNRADCYLSFGVDQTNTESYLQIVENYEQLYHYNTYIPHPMDRIRTWFQSIHPDTLLNK
jgi:hypothetical protein